MSYTIHARFRCQCNDSVSIVEKTVWHYANGGTWSEVDGQQVLTMGGSGTSGTLRFKSESGDYFLVALGVHNYKRWCDIVTDLTSSNTGVEIHPTYYQSEGRGDMLWKQLDKYEKTDCKGKKINVDYYQQDGNTYWANITVSG